MIGRLLDCFLASEEGIQDLLVYSGASLLMKFSNKIKNISKFEQIMTLLNYLPTSEWGEEDIKMMLAETHLYKKCYHQELINITQKNLGEGPGGRSPSKAENMTENG